MSDLVFYEKNCLVGISCEEANQIQNRYREEFGKAKNKATKAQRGVVLSKVCYSIREHETSKVLLSGIWISEEQISTQIQNKQNRYSK